MANNSGVHILDAKALEVFRPRDEHNQSVKRYLAEMMSKEPGRFVDNIHAEVLGLEAEGQLLPLVVGTGSRGESSVVSPTGHYVEYARHELGCVRGETKYRGLGDMLALLGMSWRALGMDRVVYVNNFLWSTNPWPTLGGETVKEIIRKLAREYPDHAISFRSVNPVEHPAFARALRGAGCTMPVARVVYMADWRKGRSGKHHNLKTDFALLAGGDFDIVEGEHFTDEDVRRMSPLYRGLYIDKHVALNPQLNEDYFRMIMRSGLMEFKGLRRRGALVGFVGWVAHGDRLLGSSIGYDTGSPVEEGLYRRLMALFFRKAMEEKMVLNLSGGASRFKRLRGATPAVEYEAVFHEHLPIHRRLPWWTVGGIYTGEVVKKFQ